MPIAVLPDCKTTRGVDNMNIHTQWTVCIVLSLALLSSAFGQVSTANFYGIVADSSGAVVPQAAVTMTNTETAAVFRKMTDGTGEFLFDFLPTGTYNLRIEAQGFKVNEAKGITLTAGQQARQTYMLDVG